MSEDDPDIEIETETLGIVVKKHELVLDQDTDENIRCTFGERNDDSSVSYNQSTI